MKIFFHCSLLLFIISSTAWAEEPLLSHQMEICDGVCGTTERITLDVHAGILYFDTRSGSELVLTVYSPDDEVLEASLPLRTDVCVRWFSDTMSLSADEHVCDNYAVYTDARGGETIFTNNIALAVEPVWLAVQGEGGAITLNWQIAESPVAFGAAMFPSPHCEVVEDEATTCDCEHYFEVTGITPTEQEVVLTCSDPLEEEPELILPPRG